MAVEFAAVAPLLLAVVVGMLELSRVYTVQNTLETAAREGARFASLDRTDMLMNGQTANQKLDQRRQEFPRLGGHQQERRHRSSRRRRAPDARPSTWTTRPTTCKLFQIKIHVPYSKVSLSPVKHYQDYQPVGDAHVPQWPSDALAITKHPRPLLARPLSTESENAP